MAAAAHHRNRRLIRRERIFRDRQNPLDIFDDVELYEKFRFRRNHILQVSEEVEPYLLQNGLRGGLLPPHLQVCLALRFFATGTFQNAIGEMIGVSQPTMSRTVKRVMDGFIQLLPNYI
ncbi:hypothetical protein ElyMa_001628100 [Elysia marginata]|uniref:Nuclease HARBI1 n=1 Tax=Elysia marginata TaxID=1093978 RepID=A0AAV4JN50_9GAST|nr:hypothetical protein ElyMa_001628100 [Elysia marginata]